MLTLAVAISTKPHGDVQGGLQLSTGLIIAVAALTAILIAVRLAMAARH